MQLSRKRSSAPSWIKEYFSNHGLTSEKKTLAGFLLDDVSCFDSTGPLRWKEHPVETCLSWQCRDAITPHGHPPQRHTKTPSPLHFSPLDGNSALLKGFIREDEKRLFHKLHTLKSTWRLNRHVSEQIGRQISVHPWGEVQLILGFPQR